MKYSELHLYKICKRVVFSKFYTPVERLTRVNRVKWWARARMEISIAISKATMCVQDRFVKIAVAGVRIKIIFFPPKQPRYKRINDTGYRQPFASMHVWTKAKEKTTKLCSPKARDRTKQLAVSLCFSRNLNHAEKKEAFPRYNC